MKLSDAFKELRAIAPDPAYTARSRMMLVGDIPAVPALPRMTVWRFLAHSVQFGSAVALTGLLVVLATGGFSLGRLLSPLRSLDATGIQAEAQAVDAQMELSNLYYAPSTSTEGSTLVRAAPARRMKVVAPVADGSPAASSSEDREPSPTIEDALDLLSQ